MVVVVVVVARGQEGPGERRGWLEVVAQLTDCAAAGSFTTTVGPDASCSPLTSSQPQVSSSDRQRQ